ncbi:hypothetical protein ZHAS_00014719 [Anopheles sinensis]|uniref:Uncharacterized protein n=1 Tax=Anopheles sinensis TaxID=74873 RepID=A0A084W926_ANOSI|nr:hypothetical protein ZHAS_00014719 [Anopheles sinensis]
MISFEENGSSQQDQTSPNRPPTEQTERTIERNETNDRRRGKKHGMEPHTELQLFSTGLADPQA